MQRRYCKEVEVCTALLGALDGAHEQATEIVHRDVKASNVLFDRQGRVRLGDWGLAQVANVSGRSKLGGEQHPGTPLYMAPEQGQSSEYLMPAADLYVLGCVLFEMVTVPEGELLMGSMDDDSDADGDEKPQHRVYLDGYQIGKTPVTKTQRVPARGAAAC